MMRVGLQKAINGLQSATKITKSDKMNYKLRQSVNYKVWCHSRYAWWNKTNIMRKFTKLRVSIR